MISQDVNIPVGGSQMRAHLARPEEGSGPHPAVIVLQDVFGLTPETKRITQLLPSIGYNGLAINYYHRTHPQVSEPYTEEGSRRAFEIAATLKARDLMQDVRAAAHWLNDQPFVKPGKIATWGFGFGATAAFVSSSLEELRGTICFSPANIATPMPSGGEPPLDHAREVRVPLLMVFGEQDYYISRHDMDRIQQVLTSVGKELLLQIYPNVGHSFFRHGRPEAIVEQRRYSDEAAAQAVADSWNLVKAFLLDVFNRPQARASESGDIYTSHIEAIEL